jgi:hypothetical protein
MNLWIRIRLGVEVYVYPTEKSAVEDQARDRNQWGNMVLEVKAASLKKQLKKGTIPCISLGPNPHPFDMQPQRITVPLSWLLQVEKALGMKLHLEDPPRLALVPTPGATPSTEQSS